MTTVLDRDGAPDFAALLVGLARGYVPEWQPGDRGAGAAFVQIAAHDLAAVGRRLERAPTKNELAFLEALGVRLVPAQPARAPLVVELAPTASDVHMAAGTRIAAAPPPGSTTQVTYETERTIGVAVTQLQEVRTLWPGRDEVCDHTEAVNAGTPFTLFDPLGLEPTPHVLYLAHDRLLALAGSSAVTVSFELLTGSSDHLDLRWECFDGKAWRPFRDMRPACSDQTTELLDSTDGLRASGAYRLESDCAKTAPTQVGGITARWVRAVLQETLPPDAGRVLPEVGAIRLSTEISHAYADIWDVREAAATEGTLGARSDEDLLVTARDASGVPMNEVEVEVLETSNGIKNKTTAQGTTEVKAIPGQPVTLVVDVDRFQQQHVVTVPEGTPVDVTLTLDMAALDLAVAEGTTVDVSKPFFPFGVQPQPGAAFYFSYAEAFAKPGARLRLYVQPSTTPQDGLGTGTDLSHTVSWEYFDGRSWVSLRSATAASVGDASATDLRKRGTLDLVVPDDLQPTTVAEQEAVWMRVRLVQGGYGVTRKITVSPNNEISFFVPQPPALADLRIGYSWQDGPHPCEHVVAHNDFQDVDRTAAATWPGTPWRPFTPVVDSTPALYLGFDRGLPVDELGIWVDVAEERGAPDGPALVWEYSDGLGWRRLSVDDETHDLRVPGILGLLGPEDMGALPRFGEPRFWLRGRLNEDGPPGAPVVRTLIPNATWITQGQTIVDEPLGTALGDAGQVLSFAQVPVLPGQRVEIRELAGPRANTEWRAIAAALLPDPVAAVDALERWLGSEGEQTEIQSGPLRLVRDRLKHVTEVWVLWEERPTLGGSGPPDRVYAIDRARGRLHFGVRVPPRGAAVMARRYRTGGGRAGNVPTRAITQLLGPVGGVEEVFNPAPAEGGADTEADQVLARGPRSLRARGRAVTAADLETLALEASPSVAIARALPARDAGGRPAPGWVTLVITPRSAEPRPYPTAGLREHVRRYLEARACGGLPPGRIVVTGPEFQPVDVSATLVPVDLTVAGAVERGVHAALLAFLHPLLGGPDGRGWTPGQSVYASDVAAVIEHVDGVDYATELALLRGGVAAGERLAVAADRIPVAGDLRLRLAGV